MDNISGLIQKFVVRYIKNNMGQRNSQNRDEIFEAITDGLQKEFTEDTIPGLIYFGVNLLLKNDTRFYRVINTQDFSNDKNSYGDMIKAGLAGEVDELARRLKINKLPHSILLSTSPKKSRRKTETVREIISIYEKYTTNKAAFLRKLKAPKNDDPYAFRILTDMTFEDAQIFCKLLNSLADKNTRFHQTIDLDKNYNKSYYVYKSRVKPY